jgi:hypothetical protein
MCALDNNSGQQPDPERSERFARLGLEPGDYYFSEEGYLVFTEQYHTTRGYCCQSRCRHCPYGNAPKPKDKRT